MTTSQVNQKDNLRTGRSQYALSPFDRAERYERHQFRSLRPVTDDHELASLARAVVWLVILGLAPLILFLIAHHFNLNLFTIPSTPE